MSTNSPTMTKSITKLPVLEPLSSATGRAIDIQVGDSDYLAISYMPKQGTRPERFLLNLITRRVISEEEAKGYDDHLVNRTSTGDCVVPLEAWSASVSSEAIDWLASIPETAKTKDISQLKSLVAVTDYTAILIHSVWPRNRIIFGDKVAEAKLNFLLAQFFAQTDRARMQAEFKLQGKLPPLPPEYRKHPRNPLSPYQEAALAFALGNDGAGLFMEQGTGKTPIGTNAICVIGDRLRATEGRACRALILCPAQVRGNWKREIAKFATTKGLVQVVKGGKQKRATDIIRQIAALSPESGYNFGASIVSYDTAANDAKFLSSIDWDIVVADESHRFKWHLSKRWQTLKNVLEKAHRSLIMTGTPFGNTLMDLYTQLEAVYPGGSGFSSFKAFRQFYGRYEQRGQTATGGAIEVLVGYSNIPLLQERLTRLAFSITKKEAGLQLPDKQTGVIEVELSPKQVKAYKALADQMLAELDDDDASTVTVTHHLTKLLRLAQVTSNHTMPDEAERPVTIDPKENPKVKALMDYLEDALEWRYDDDGKKIPGRNKIVVSAHFKYDFQVISEALTKAGIKHVTYFGDTKMNDRDAIVDAYNNDPEIRVLIANPASAGEGLNLLGYDKENPDATDTYSSEMIFYSVDWSFIKRSQMEDRVHRRGMRSPVKVTDLMVPGSIDETIREAVQSKKSNALTLQDVRAILEKALDD